MWRRFLRWLLGGPAEKRQATTAAEFIAQFCGDFVPDSLEPMRFYLVGDPDEPWQAALQCPCGCGDILQLSLLEHDYPSWRVRLDGVGRVWLWPSVARGDRCGAHFFIRAGRVTWCASELTRTD